MTSTNRYITSLYLLSSLLFIHNSLIAEELPEITIKDKLFEDKDIKIIVDKKSFLYLVGTTLEYSGGLNGTGFVFSNPNASRTCGCGESFSL